MVMMKTIVSVLAAVVVTALLTFVLLRPVSPPPPPPPEAREAVVFLDERAGCQPKTLPQTIFVRVGDSLSWEILATPGCADYADDLRIRVKKGEDPSDLPIVDDSSTGPRRKASVPKEPAKCASGTGCSISYAVTVTGKGGSKQEDPRIDIWR
jgi:hypothetical protein